MNIREMHLLLSVKCSRTRLSFAEIGSMMGLSKSTVSHLKSFPTGWCNDQTAVTAIREARIDKVCTRPPPYTQTLARSLKRLGFAGVRMQKAREHAESRIRFLALSLRIAGHSMIGAARRMEGRDTALKESRYMRMYSRWEKLLVGSDNMKDEQYLIKRLGEIKLLRSHEVRCLTSSCCHMTEVEKRWLKR
jgi:hypothetical protein